MSYGLKVWDQYGRQQVDISDRLFRLHGVYTFPDYSGQEYITISIPDVSTDGTWFVTAQAQSPAYFEIINGGVKVSQFSELRTYGGVIRYGEIPGAPTDGGSFILYRM